MNNIFSKVRPSIKCILLIFICFYYVATAQDRDDMYIIYIEQHYKIAQKQQEKYNIPASITLAQGLLESAAGQSELAMKAHNHFGIKCHDWDGGSIHYKNDCYRKYRHTEESYTDHSIFLQRPRYASLYKLHITDYKGWARGLKACGYAEDPQYAKKLIDIIERYNLTQYDRAATTQKHLPQRQNIDIRQFYRWDNNNSSQRNIYKAWGLLYVEAYQGDSYEAIAAELGFNAKDLAKFNDSKPYTLLNRGDIVYLEKKHKKSSKEHEFYVAKEGDTLYDISQRYGISLKHLAKRNQLKSDAILSAGNIIRLR